MPGSVVVMVGVFVVLGCAGGALQLALAPRSPRRPPIETSRDADRKRGTPATSAAGRIARVVGAALRGAAGRPPDAQRDIVVGTTAICAVPAAAIGVGLAVIVLLAGFSFGVLVQRRRAKRHASQQDQGVAELIDLCAVALLAGHNVATVVSLVTRWSSGPFVEPFAWCDRQRNQGRALGEALEDLPVRGYPQLRPLIAALVAHDRYGAAVGESLGHLAADTRERQRRQAERAARRMPVTLLFPLVICVLPAFLLLTIVPTVADAIGAFSEITP